MPFQKNVECLRPFTALACSGIDEGVIGRTLTQPLNPANPGQISRSNFRSRNWDWLPLAGDRPASGMISICGEFQHGQEWWLLATAGLYHSTDGGAILKRVLDEKGTLLKYGSSGGGTRLKLKN